MRILTAGYGNLGFAGFIQRVRSLSVTHLVDVRAVPWSNYYTEFRREELPGLMLQTGIRYVYMGDTLGGLKGSSALCKKPDEVLAVVREASETRITVEELLAKPEFQIGVRKLIEAATEPERTICLMCGCLRAEVCHRSWLLGEALIRQGVQVEHVADDGSLLSQEAVMRLRRPKQHSLF